MNLKLWVEKNSLGTTPLHDIVSNGHQDRIPKELFKAKYFLTRNSYGETPLHLAMKPGKVKYIPVELIMGRAILNLFRANHAQTFCDEYIFSAMLKGPPKLNILAPDCRGITPLHIAAEKGCLNELPKECLQPRYMMTKGLKGYTPMHYAMRSLSRSIVPSSCFSKQSLTVKANDHETPLDVLCDHIIKTRDLTGLKSFPKELQTNEIFLREGPSGSLLHALARTGSLAHAPKSVITLENMFLPVASDNEAVNGKSAFDLMKPIDYYSICHLELPESAINIIGKEEWDSINTVARDKALLEKTHESVSVDLF